MQFLPVRLRPFAASALIGLLASAATSSSPGQGAPAPAPRLKEEMRSPWTRSHERFIRRWQVLGEIPLAASPEAFAQDPIAQGGEATLHPSDQPAQLAHPLARGATLNWRATTSWGDAVDLSDGNGLKRDLVAYAAATIARPEAGKALLCLGSDESIRAWVNGTLVLHRRGR